MDAIKKAKLEADATDVDSTGDTATLVSLKTSTTNKEILKRLRPILLSLDPFADTASICPVLEGLEFLQLSPLIFGGQIDSILASLFEVYKDARRHEAEKVPTEGAVEMHQSSASMPWFL